MSEIVKESKLRSVLKGISWRIVGTIDTITIAFFITGNIGKALSIGGAEIITKLILFYIHERIWIYFTNGNTQTKFRSLLKAVTWRLTGTLDTITISFLIISFGSEGAAADRSFHKASAIAIIELFTKIALFYLHERLWNRIDFGRETVEVQ